MIGPLNYHHLHYFWCVARDGNLTRTARRLRVSQSALSAQIRQLEEALGEPLFRREGRALALTEAGVVALEHADTIFGAGGELVRTLEEGRRAAETLRVGAVATLSRNFQESFVRPLLRRPGLRLRLCSGALPDLLARLAEHALDVVLSNDVARAEGAGTWRSQRIATQAVSLVGPPRAAPFRWPDDLEGLPLILPGPDSQVRAEFDALCARLGARPRALAEVDDMATMRLLARDAPAVALLPSVVVRDELLAGALLEYCEVPGLREAFYAITVERRYPHPLVRALLARGEAELLEMREPELRLGASQAR